MPMFAKHGFKLDHRRLLDDDEFLQGTLKNEQARHKQDARAKKIGKWLKKIAPIQTTALVVLIPPVADIYEGGSPDHAKKFASDMANFLRILSDNAPRGLPILIPGLPLRLNNWKPAQLALIELEKKFINNKLKDRDNIYFADLLFPRFVDPKSAVFKSPKDEPSKVHHCPTHTWLASAGLAYILFAKQILLSP